MKAKLKQLAQLAAKLKALLLIGGAFLLFGLFAFQRYAIFPDKTSALVPETALAHLTLLDPAHTASQLLPEMHEEMGNVIQIIRFHEDSSLSLFVYGIVDKSIQWGFVTDANIDEIMLPEAYTAQSLGSNLKIVTNHPSYDSALPEGQTQYKLVSKRADGFGTVMFKGQQLPVKFFLEADKAFRFKVGHEFRGLFPEHKDAAFKAPKFTFLPEHTSLYLNDDTFPATLEALSKHLKKESIELNAPIEPILLEIPGRTELLIANPPETSPTFTIVSTPQAGFELDYNAFDRAIMAYLGQLDPMTEEIRLKDGTRSFEKRSSSSEIEMKENRLSTGALYRSFTSHTGEYRLVYLIDHLGSIWVSNEPNMLQALVYASLNSAMNPHICSLNGDETGFIINPKSAQELDMVRPELLDWVRGLTSVTFKLNNHETGLFTLCGYF